MSAYSKLFTGLLRPAWDTVRGRAYSTRLRSLDESQWWTPDQVEAFQWAELQPLLTQAFESVPYLKRKYRDAGVERGDIRSLADFRRLPPLTREEINAHGRELCSTAYKGKLLPHATGGSTGTPTRFFRTYESYDWRTAAKDRVYGWAGLGPAERAVYLWGAAVGAVSRQQKLKTWVYDRVHQQLIFSTFSQTDELWQRIHAAIVRYRPVVIVGYVSSLEEYAAFVKRTNLTLPPLKGVIAAAEPLFSSARQAIETALGAPVFNTYGSREFMSIAGECQEHRGLHINAENILVETSNVSTTEPSELLVTDLHNYGMPFIRYATGDSGRLTTASCPCGRGLPRLESIEGRVLDLLRTVDGRTVPGEFFPHLLKEIPEFSQFRVEQKALDHIVISVVLSQPMSEKSRQLLEHEVLKVFGAATRCEVQPVEAIPNLKSGKRRVTVGMAS